MRPSRATAQEEKPVRGQLISIREAVKRYPLGKDWYYRHMDNGTLPFPWFMLSKRCMDTADIDDWLRLMKVPAGKMPGDTEEARMG